jgi:hypothetical protein
MATKQRKHISSSTVAVPFVLDDESFTERTVHVEVLASSPGRAGDGILKPSARLLGALLLATGRTWDPTDSVNVTVTWRIPSDDSSDQRKDGSSTLEAVPIALLDALGVLIPALTAQARRDGVLPAVPGER